MRIPKWLKRFRCRDKSNRRCSDSHAVVFNDSLSPRSDNFEDPIRTEEYKKDLADFLARRSLGPIDENSSREKYQNQKKDDRKPRSEKKPKRLSLPDTQIISSNAPNIQFSFSNQLYLPSNGKKNKNKNGSLTSTSPDLLPPRFIRNKNVDFEESENPSSPPDDFFKDNSLPYFDKESSMIFESKSSRRINSPAAKNTSSNSDKGIHKTNYNNSKNTSDQQELDDSCDLERTDGSFDSVMRKLEQMCQTVKPNFVYFRGVPLVRNNSVNFLGDHNSDLIEKKNVNWHFATWNNVSVIVKNTKQKKFSSKEISVKQYIFTDIDILTKIRHSNILLLMGISYENNLNISTIFEDSVSSLYDYVHIKKIGLSPHTIVTYLNGIARALIYLNSNNYVHTSVSSHSIILTSSNIAKLCNFELCSPILTNNSYSHEEAAVNSNNIYKISYSSDPEYENIKEFAKNNESNDDLFSTPQECSPQNTTARLLFSYFRWQAPELFDNIDNFVYPSSNTDVYSLCLVLWECFNNSPPWKSLSYKQLSNLYLRWNTGIKLHQKDFYPEDIYNILSRGLNIKPNQRPSIHEIQKQFSLALKKLIIDDSIPENILNPNNTDTIADCGEFREEENIENGDAKINVIKEHPITCKVKNVKKFEVTNLDEDDNDSNTNCYSNEQFYTEMKEHSVNISSLGLSNKSFEVESYPDNSFRFHNTDSTEYCSLPSPDVKNYTKRSSNVDVSLNKSKSSFCEENLIDKESSVNEKILKLNTSLTPKLYKPLHIQTPSADTINSIRSLTNSFECKNDLNKSTYSFDIQNTSLPMTPIARNNKIKKNAWLSGKNKELSNCETQTYSDSNKKIFDSKLDANNSNKTTTSFDVHFKSFSDIDTQTEIHIPETNSYRSSVSLNTDGFSSSQKCIGTLTDDHFSNFQTFRRRSYSLNSKSSATRKIRDDISGVDIKPIVAIHEKWIMEACKKQGRSFSLPDNYRGLYAVKPASHLTDPARPKYMSMYSNISEKSDKIFHTGCYSDISPMVRPAVTKKRILNENTNDFFENSLWRKEKEKCVLNSKNHNDPQSSSTPKSVPFKKELCNDKSTNTESIDELYRKIISDIQNGSIAKNDTCDEKFVKKFKSPDILNESDIKSAKTSVIAELTHRFEKTTHNQSTDNNYNHFSGAAFKRIGSEEYFDMAVTLNPKSDDKTTTENYCEFDGVSVLEKRKLFDKTLDRDNDYANDFFRNNIEDDCISLPDNATQAETDDTGIKQLKRCQAFTALQDARSTEDMYIDDELMSNIDAQTLNENARLVPLHSNIHEATCDKGSECCLLKIQYENKCNRILIFCDESNKSSKDKCNYSSDEEEELLKLSVDNHFPLNLNDLKCSRNKLSVIEEKSDEDTNTDRDSVESAENKYIGNGNIVQDLISLYESDEICKVTENNENGPVSNKQNSSKSEISIIIMDDEFEDTNKTYNIYGKKHSSSMIEDIIHV